MLCVEAVMVQIMERIVCSYYVYMVVVVLFEFVDYCIGVVLELCECTGITNNGETVFKNCK